MRLIISACAPLLVTSIALAHATQAPADEANVRAGKKLYDEACAFCHGATGRGDGPQAFFLAPYAGPRPRSFQTEPFKFRSTSTGQLPTDADLFRVITEGRPGYMPAFVELTETQRWQLVSYVKTLHPPFRESERPPVPISMGTPSAATLASVARGREVYKTLECGMCHGPDGRGDGPSAPTLTDERGMKIRATDLTRPSSFGNGSSAEDIYRTFMTGLNGTPMPSYADAVSAEDAWHLVNYIRSLSIEGR